MIRPVKLTDADDIRDIYNGYILNSRITFEEQVITSENIIERIQNITKNYPWLVYENDGNVLGYTYAVRWKERSAYRHSVETAIYLHPNVLGQGIGTRLKSALLDELKSFGVHCVISGIALPNPASIALCEKFGFSKVAHFKEVGFKMKLWVDVGYWELIFDKN